MELERVSAVVRPRRSWEAIDLGFSMTRQWWLAIIIPWLMITLPIFILLNIIFISNTFFAILCFWWLKPWFDRLPLYVASHALFGDKPSVRQTLKAYPGLLSHQAVAALTWHRISLSRSFYLPLWQLEKVQDKAYRQRADILGQESHSDSVWLTLVCMHFEMLITFGLVLLFFLMVPDSLYEFDPMTVISDRPFAYQLLSNATYYLALTLIEPFYVCGGFSLYLNRRTVLEAWDIELAFRRLDQRLKEKRATK